jgi:hypothetical protein
VWPQSTCDKKIGTEFKTIHPQRGRSYERSRLAPINAQMLQNFNWPPTGSARTEFKFEWFLKVLFCRPQMVEGRKSVVN